MNDVGKEYLASLEWPKESLDMMDMAMDIEDYFDILLTDADLAEVTNKVELAELVEKKLNAKQLLET